MGSLIEQNLAVVVDAITDTAHGTKLIDRISLLLESLCQPLGRNVLDFLAMVLIQFSHDVRIKQVKKPFQSGFVRLQKRDFPDS